MAKRRSRNPNHDTYGADGSLWDRRGHQWRRRRGIIAPSEADAMVRDGAPWAIEWCGGGRDWHTALGTNAWDDIQRKLIDVDTQRKVATKAERTGRSKTVMFAEEWTDGEGASLVLVVEGGPSLR